MSNHSEHQSVLAPFFEQAKKHPNKLAIIDAKGRKLSYAELSTRSSAMAAKLRSKGVLPQMRVLLAAPVGVDLYVAMAALWRLGAVIVFPEPAMGLKGLRAAVEIAKPDAFLGLGKFAFLPLISSTIRKIPQRLRVGPLGQDAAVFEDHKANEAQTALISFTSGSTGKPKAIERSHAFLLAQNKALAPIIGGARAQDVDLVAFPVFVIAELALGGTSVLPNWPLKNHNKVKPDALVARIEQQAVTRLLVPPSLCEILSQSKAASGLNCIFTGGGPVFPDILEKLHDLYPEAKIVSVYGSTEAEPIAVQEFHKISNENWQAMNNGKGLFAGKPIDAIDVEIWNDEIIVSGAHVNKSYMDKAQNTENKIMRDGQIWHRTGDAGALDEEGNLWLKGRLSAKAGPYYPFEIEPKARRVQGVREAALVPQTVPPILAISGDEPHVGAWQAALCEYDDLRIVELDKIPMDKRHQSKVNYVGLNALLKST